jgi:hypothetical protein
MKKRKVRLHALKCCLFGKYRHCPQHRRLPTPRYGAAIRHIGRLVPGKQRPRRVEIVNLQQPVLQVCDDRVGRLPVHPAIAMPLDLAGGCLSELDRGGLGFHIAAHAWLVMNCPASSYTHPRPKTTKHAVGHCEAGSALAQGRLPRSSAWSSYARDAARQTPPAP